MQRKDKEKEVKVSEELNNGLCIWIGNGGREEKGPQFKQLEYMNALELIFRTLMSLLVGGAFK